MFNQSDLLLRIKAKGLVDVKINNNNNLWQKSVYIAKRSHNWYKIGVSKNIPQRIAGLQVGSPEKLKVIHSIPLEGKVFFVERSVIKNIGQNLPSGSKSGEWVRIQGSEAEIKKLFTYVVKGVISKLGKDTRSEEQRWNLAMEKKFPLLAWSYMKSPLRTFIRK
tara:strand:+ start:1042 stop:1533 length:492 start_codon:yes stop_codon:yes gene_type:complete